MPRVYLVTLGCPKNVVASKRLERGLERAGIELVSQPETADALVVNTCGFIEPAIEEAIDELLELGRHKRGREQKLIAIGCLAERYGQELVDEMPELDHCLGFDELVRLPALLDVPKPLLLDGQARDRQLFGYLEITMGCDHHCSFCVIPSIHGPFRSRATAKVREEARALVRAGCRELVMIGQETGAYGSDLEPRTDLSELLLAVADDNESTWLRVLYLQWYHMTEKLVETIASRPALCDYLDIPVQHASAGIVRAMNRRGDSDAYLGRIGLLRDYIPDVALRTSVIVGFPGETQTDLLELADFLKAAEFDYVGVFEFSAENGTEAANLPNRVAPAVKRERAEQIRLLADNISRERRGRWLGRTVDVLVESENPDSYTGRARFQAPEIDGEIVFTGSGHALGEIVRVVVEDTQEYEIRGRAVDAKYR